MIAPAFFCQTVKDEGTEFFTGVPDSLLKDLCAYVTDNVEGSNHIIAANEGNAVGLATGYYLATETIPLVYMQNSGQGNTVNPLVSLTDSDVYNIPLLLLVGWRGEPGVKDEPQHVKQGKITCALMDTLGIPYVILSDDEKTASEQIQKAYAYMRESKSSYALIIKKGTFSSYTLQKNSPVTGLVREKVIETIVQTEAEETLFVATTGMISRELYEIREKLQMGHKRDFLTVGAMGHTSQIALGVALGATRGKGLSKGQKIICLDGDGSLLMHMGGLAIIGQSNMTAFVHIVLNNGAHDSVGGQPTLARSIDLCAIARAAGYAHTYRVETNEQLVNALHCTTDDGPLFIEVFVAKGSRADLGRPKETPKENKQLFMENIKI